MKKLIFILAATLLVTGCATNKCGILETLDSRRVITVIDSENSVYEDPNKPGTFYNNYDTIRIEVINKFDRRNNYKTTYKILN